MRLPKEFRKRNLDPLTRYEPNENSMHLLDVASNHLAHFTNVRNLESISKHGLLTFENCMSLGLAPVAFDKGRKDETEQGISLSLGMPNYKMLLKRFFDTAQSENYLMNLVFLRIDFNVLFQRHFLAFPTNSARFEGLNEAQLLKYANYEGYFNLFKEGPILGDANIWINRKDLHLHDYMPTDPQAEIVCLNDIPVTAITGVTIWESTVRHLGFDYFDNLLKNFPNATVTVTRNGGIPERHDSSFWSKGRTLDWNNLEEPRGGGCGCSNCLPPGTFI